MELVHSIHAHPGNCICIKFEPQGRYFATGSADALVSIWDAQELYCKRTLPRYEGALAKDILLVVQEFLKNDGKYAYCEGRMH